MVTAGYCICQTLYNDRVPHVGFIPIDWYWIFSVTFDNGAAGTMRGCGMYVATRTASCSNDLKAGLQKTPFEEIDRS
jgi:hypothetical protein